MSYIYLVGVDGSGKTTAAHALAALLNQEGRSTIRFYGAYRALLLRPIKWLARNTVMRGTSEFGDYSAYADRKSDVSRRLPIVSRVYATLWLLDYTLSTLIRLAWASLRHENVVLDRYYLDQVVNISSSLRLSDADLKRMAGMVRRFFPRPDVQLFLDLPVDTAFGRKQDIPSIHYVQERRSRYLLLLEDFDFRVVDASADTSAVLDEVARVVRQTLFDGPDDQ